LLQGRSASLFPLALVGLLAGLTYWLYLASQPQDRQADGRQRHDPDYFVDNFEVRRYGPEGVLLHTLKATQMRHYPDDDSTVVLAPDLTYHREPPTFVTAREARMDGKGEHVELIDDVRVKRAGKQGKPDTLLATARLDVLPDEETASTRLPVTITQGGSRVSGSAMQSNNKTAIHVLEGPVHGIFPRDASRYPPPSAESEQAAPAAKPVRQSAPTARPKPKAKPKTKPRTKQSTSSKTKR
jgi:lipopolysaccharide export system protein LptC